jgi:hypothetical protein
MTDESTNAESFGEMTRLDEELSAYLDRELSPEESRQVEQLITSDATVRQRLRDLEMSWEALDQLHSTPLGDRFTHTTMEMVAMAANEDVAATSAALPARQRRRWLMAVVALLCAGAAGFAVAAMLRPDPNRRLLDNLPLVEHLEQFRQAQSLDFLKRLAAEHLFGDDVAFYPPTEPRTPPAEETISERRARILKMSDTEREDLRRHFEQFLALDASQQHQLRYFRDKLDRDPQAAELEAVMERFHKWFSSLPTYRWAELLSLGPEERIKRIKFLVDEQTQKFSNQDFAGLRHWIDQYVARHGEEVFLRSLPEESRRALERMPPEKRKRAIVAMLLTWRGLLQNTQDLADLRNGLTPTTRDRLAALPPDEQRQMIADAVRQWVRPQMAGKSKYPWAMIDDADLARYFEKALTFEQRDRLLALPAEDMQRELRQMYLSRAGSGNVTSDHWPGRTGKHPQQGSGGPFTDRPKHTGLDANSNHP